MYLNLYTSIHLRTSQYSLDVNEEDQSYHTQKKSILLWPSKPLCSGKALLRRALADIHLRFRFRLTTYNPVRYVGGDIAFGLAS